VDLTYVPLLQVQRDLYRMARGVERFREYIRTMVDAETKDLEIPITAMNPMGKDHVPKLLDEFLACNADTEAAQAIEEILPRLRDVGGNFRVTMVLSDDAQGAWTNRIASEFSRRFETKALHRRGWITGLLWSSEPASSKLVREEARLSVYRAAHIQRHGYAKTLREILAQEGYAAEMARSADPGLSADDLDYTREVLQPLLDATDKPTLVAALFGDPGARELGYDRLGLSSRAGFALAIANARAAR